MTSLKRRLKTSNETRVMFRCTWRGITRSTSLITGAVQVAETGVEVVSHAIDRATEMSQ